MRGAMWVIATVGWLLWLAAVGYPAAAAGAAMLLEPASDVDRTGTGRLLLTTVTWSAAIALAAMLLGWAPGRVLGAALHGRRFAPLAAACVLPVCLPAYLVFYAWWQSWPADSALYRWAVGAGLVRDLRLLTLLLSLVCWSWPIVAWSTAGLAAGDARRRAEMLRLDGAGRLRCLGAALRHDAPGLLLGGAVVFLLSFQNTTCFDLAEVFTFGNELRALAQSGGTPRDLLVTAGPALALALGASVVLWTLLARGRSTAAARASRPGAAVTGVTVVIWLLTVAAPIGLLLKGLREGGRLAEFFRLYGEGFGNAVGLSTLSALLAATVAVALAGQWGDRRPAIRGAGHLQALGWLVAAVVPATIAAAGLEAAYNIPVVVVETAQNVRESLAEAAGQSEITIADLMYRNPVILLLGHLSRFGAVGALFGWWLVRQEPRPCRDMRRQDGAEHLRGWLAAMGAPVVAAVSGAFAVVLVLSLAEVSVTSQIQPPGVPLIASTVLNDMHYQRPQTVMIAASLFSALAALAAVVVVLGWSVARRPLAAACVALLLLAGGCSRSEPGAVRPLDARVTFGAPGLAPGQFNYPRGIAVDAGRDRLFVVDKTARVQRFSLDGKPQAHWRMPEFELGKPTGLNVGPDGTVYVADTHYFRVIRYDADGRELLRFGSYGEGPGQFIYPTDVAFAPDGRLYVSEYGGNDRVQIFSPEGELLSAFGTFGSGDGQFNRPQSMVFSTDGSELYIADACNHRIVVVDPDGRTLRVLGSSGHGPGELMYPYDLALMEDGTLIVCEFGNNRIQRLASDGRCLELLGGEGPGPGRLRYPWGIDVAGEQVFVLDSGNNRVHVLEL
jgi:DNA-binding beta-propeller fold protein YncE/ABC-type Fe3+ transport system permease subunit